MTLTVVRSKKRRKKQPFNFRLRSGEPFGLAGVWEAWHSPDDERVESVAILTTDPNDLVRAAHNHMPVILQPRYYDDWLDPEVQDADLLTTMSRPFPAEEMEAVPVSDYVNNARQEGPECMSGPG
jgi:putative SOS response-associated peptidase YedK